MSSAGDRRQASCEPPGFCFAHRGAQWAGASPRSRSRRGGLLSPYDESFPKSEEPVMTIAAFSKSRLSRMHDVMARHVESGSVPGLVTLISRHGDVHVDAIGMKANGGGDRMQRDTIFRIASMTKPIVA